MTLIWMDSTYIVNHKNEPFVMVFARDTVTKLVETFQFKGFKPYYYVSDPHGELLSCYGEPITRVEVDSPRDVNDSKRGFSPQTKFYESDVAYDMRFMLDRNIQYAFDDKGFPVETDELISPRICYFDIEVLIPEGGNIDAKTAEYSINVISFKDSYTGNTKILTAGMKVVAEDQENFSTEKQLLEAFAKHVHDIDFDIITGWYSEDFDIPYILNRADKLRANIKGFSRLNTLPPNDFRFPGRHRLDMMAYFKKWSTPMGKMPYDLKSVAKMADYFYEDYGANIVPLTEAEDWETIVTYARHDVEALYRIDDKFKLFSFYESFRKLVGCKVTDVLNPTKYVEWFIMRMGVKPMPTRTKHDKIEYSGAHVVLPKVGLHENIGAVDIAAMYPFIMCAYNISPDIDKTIPKAIKLAMDKREELRARRLAGDNDPVLATSEQALKAMTNAFYGYLGSPYARMYSPKDAGKITSTGVEMGFAIDRILISKGYEVLYGDTDSRFFGPVLSIEEGMEVDKALNEFLGEWADEMNMDHKYAPSIKLEKIYDKILFKKKNNSDEAAKKNYAGHLIWKDGYTVDKLDFTGISIVRSDSSAISKEIMEKFFNILFYEGDAKKASRMVAGNYRKVKGGQVSVHDVALPRSSRSEKDNAWKRGRINGEKLLSIRFESGSTPKLLHCKFPYAEVCIDDDILNESVISIVNVDWDIMADKTIKRKMESLIESVGYTWDQIVFSQLTLSEMMGSV